MALNELGLMVKVLASMLNLKNTSYLYHLMNPNITKSCRVDFRYRLEKVLTERGFDVKRHPIFFEVDYRHSDIEKVTK